MARRAGLAAVVSRFGGKIVDASPALWDLVGDVLEGQASGTVIATLLNGLCAHLVASGQCADERHARAYLAVILISPPELGRPGGLLSLAVEMLAELRAEVEGAAH